MVSCYEVSVDRPSMTEGDEKRREEKGNIGRAAMSCPSWTATSHLRVV